MPFWRSLLLNCSPVVYGILKILWSEYNSTPIFSLQSETLLIISYWNVSVINPVLKCTFSFQWCFFFFISLCLVFMYWISFLCQKQQHNNNITKVPVMVYEDLEDQIKQKINQCDLSYNLWLTYMMTLNAIQEIQIKYKKKENLNLWILYFLHRHGHFFRNLTS